MTEYFASIINAAEVTSQRLKEISTCLEVLTQSVFSFVVAGKKIGEQLMNLKQCKKWAAEYALEFLTLAAESDWKKPALQAAFLRGVKLNLLTELACHNDQVLYLLSQSLRWPSVLITWSRAVSYIKGGTHIRSAEPPQVSHAKLTFMLLNGKGKRRNVSANVVQIIR